jgi:ABC-type dipeptide/oligopeptide/nickel transport system permease subunit
MRRGAAAFLVALGLLIALGPLASSHGYAAQDREHILDAPDARHWLGTDALGRDNFARFLHGGRLSVTMAGVAALSACAIAAAIGTAGALGGTARIASAAVFDVMLSTPWYLLVFVVRAILPLDAPPLTTAAVTFFILGLTGWAHGGRVIRDAVSEMANGPWVRQARASGCGGIALWRGHIVPNLYPLLLTQFLLLLPMLMLAEATLGMLGLGIPEPLPSWGGSLAELVRPDTATQRPWTLIPALLLALTSISLRQMAGGAEKREAILG